MRARRRVSSSRRARCRRLSPNSPIRSPATGFAIRPVARHRCCCARARKCPTPISSFSARSLTAARARLLGSICFCMPKTARASTGATRLNSPTLIESDHLMRFDVVVANPPFSLDKWWGNTDSEGTPSPTPTSASPRTCRPRVAAITPSSAHAGDRKAVRRACVVVVAPHGVLFRSGPRARSARS